MGKFIDMTGWKMWEHGVPDSRLIVIERAENYITPNGCVKTQWLCECSCKDHNKTIVNTQRLRRGETLSCGCLQIERATEKIKKAQVTAAKLKRKHNEYTFFDNYGCGKFTNCDDVFYFDLDDYDKIKDYAWYSSDGYAWAHLRGTNNNKHISMHSLLGFKHGDHINRNRADNRKSNLRHATAQENVWNRDRSSNNTSGYQGVSWKKDKLKWKAYISIDGKQIHLGYFDDIKDALIARLEGEVKYCKAGFEPQRDLFAEYGIERKDNADALD